MGDDRIAVVVRSADQSRVHHVRPRTRYSRFSVGVLRGDARSPIAHGRMDLFRPEQALRSRTPCDQKPEIMSKRYETMSTERRVPSPAPNTDDEWRHLTTHVGYAGMGSFPMATPSDSRRIPVNSADWVFSSDASYPSQANRS